jgi:serine/threonine protein kinase
MKVGIRLFYDSARQFTFYCNNPSILEAWYCLLAKKLNQKGFHEMFKPLRKLGKGNFATVYEVERTTDGRRFAVKAFSKVHAFNAKNGK